MICVYISYVILLFVVCGKNPEARGLGLGRFLVRERGELPPCTGRPLDFSARGRFLIREE